jgi:DNA repair exonuclease SbcCD ATPase subunit/DNA repair exonuclease SbcCD nuclease subunit
MSIRKLPLPSSGIIRKIIHISDIHIRLLSEQRHDEYLQVFRSFIGMVCQMNGLDEMVCVVTGDIFDKKNILDTTSIHLCSELLHPIADLMPVYLITGNHDYRQDLHDNSDMIQAIASIMHRQNVVHLETTGLYEAGDVGFGIVAVSDTLIRGATSGQVAVLPEFPNPDLLVNSKVKIALFHGTIIKCKMQNGMTSPHGFPIEWFNGYDIALFGDIHLQQIYNVIEMPTNGSDVNIKKYSWNFDECGPVWGYPGSLIQQNFGEPIFPHGFFIWDIDDGYVEAWNVPSDYAFLDCKNNGGKWEAFINGICHPPIELSLLFETYPQFATKLKLRIRGSIDATKMTLLRNILEQYQKQIIFAKTCHNIELNLQNNQITGTISGEDDDDDIADADADEDAVDDLVFNSQKEFDLSLYNSPERFIDYIKKNIVFTINTDTCGYKNWIYHPETLLVDSKRLVTTTNNKELEDKINERNRTIHKLIAQYSADLEASKTIPKQKMALCFMRWAWILCYIDDNYLDFSQMIGKISVINGPNDAGKTSLLNTICVGIFGDEIPSRLNRQRSGNIISNSKPLKEKAFIEIVMTVGDIQYILLREIIVGKDSRLTYKAKLSYFDSGAMLHEGNVAVNNWIKVNIGTLDDFLTSCMLTQKSDKEFFKLKPSEQLALFDNALRLDTVSSFVALIDESLKAHDYFKTYFKSQTDHLLSLHSLSEIKTEIQVLENLTESLKNRIPIHPPTAPTHSYTLSEITDKIRSTSSQFQTCSLTNEELLHRQIDIQHKRDDLLAKYSSDELSSVIVSHTPSIITPPQISKEYCFEMIEKILQHKPDHSKLRSYISLLTCRIKEISLMTIARSLSELELELKSLEESRPNKPELSVSEVLSLKQQISNLQSQIQTFPPPFNDENYKITNEELNTTELSSIVSQLSLLTRQSSFFEFPSTSSSLKDLYDVTWKECNVLTSNLTVLQTELTNKQSELSISQSKYHHIASTIETIKVAPTISLEKINTFIELYDIYVMESEMKHKERDNKKRQLEQAMEINNQINNLKQQIEFTTKRINEIESHKYPFNDKCEACQQQAWKINLNNLNTTFSLLSSELEIKTNDFRKILQDSHSHSYDLPTLKQSLVSLMEWCEKFEKMASQIDYYQNQKVIYEEWEKKCAANEEKNRELNVLNNTIKTIENEITNLKKTLTYSEDILKPLQQKLQQIDFALQNMSQYNFLSLQKKRIEEQPFIIILKQYQQKLPYYLQQQTLFEKYQNYLTKKTNLEKHIEHTQISNLLNSLSEWIEYEDGLLRNARYWYQTYHREIAEIQGILDYRRWMVMSDDLHAYEQYTTSKRELDETTKRLYETKSRYDYEVMMRQRYEKQEKIYDYLNTTVSEMLQVKTLMSDYKRWLYKNLVIPKLLDFTNNIVAYATHTNQYKLQSLVNVSAKGNMEFEWYLKDTEQQPNNENELSVSSIGRPIESVGGFRQDIFNLALRIAITKLGASSIKCLQLFMDEAFVWADVSNLSKIPDFLKSILNIYQSVILVTHLETLKSCGDVEINIQFKTRTTRRIQFGKCLL